MLICAVRVRQGLPVRGQRTHTNAKTAKKLNVKRLPTEKMNKKNSPVYKQGLKQYLINTIQEDNLTKIQNINIPVKNVNKQTNNKNFNNLWKNKYKFKKKAK